MATNELYRDSRERDLNPLDGEQDQGDVKDHVRYYHGKTGMRSADEIERIRRFYQEFDAWLREIREP